MKLKICGMKHTDNIQAVAALSPDYLGFIFYEKSPRHFAGTIPALPDRIKKTGVFVDAALAYVVDKVTTYGFSAVQLHGNESAEYCTALAKELKELSLDRNIELFKVFGIRDTFDFSKLTPYEGVVDYFLFDTKGKEKGGNGYTFDWTVLKNYPSQTPFILSGGIGIDEIAALKSIAQTELPIHAIDVNSKFEDAPGLKNEQQLQLFIQQMYDTTQDISA